MTMPMMPAFSDEGAVVGAMEHGGGQAGLKMIELGARVTQSRHLNDRPRADLQAGSGWQAEQVDTLCRDILAHLTGRNLPPFFPQFRKKLAVNQVYLTQIRLVGSRATRERCWTVAPEWESPTTPLPVTRRMTL